MTQENDAADRAQHFNDASEETTVASNESFAQDWLDAEEKERAEQTSVASRPRLVATLPDWTAFSETNDERKKGGNWRVALQNGKLRTTGVAALAFGLGFLCATGSWRGETSDKNADDVAAVERQNDGENGASPEDGFGELNDNLSVSFDASTLRGVPNAASVDFIAQAQDDALATTADDGGFPDVNGWANNGETAGFSDLTVSQAPSATAEGVDDSNWRRGVDFQRELTTSTDAAAANVDRFPTWSDLDANLPTVADALNSPLEPAATNVPDASNIADANRSFPSENVGGAQNSPVLAEPSVGESVGYAAYNGNDDYQRNSEANLSGAAPQFAGNSQNSGYNQPNGSENFAGWPAPAPAPAPAANFATSAPAPAASFATSAPAPAASFATSAPAPAASFATSAPAPAANFATSAPAPAANFATSAPAPAASFATSASAPTSNFASPVATEAPRAMVAQLPTESAPAPTATANVPTANPNLRW